MDEKQITLDELSSSESFEDIKQNDIAWSCIEDIMRHEKIPEYDVFLHGDEYVKSYIYQESKYYNPFATSKENVV